MRKVGMCGGCALEPVSQQELGVVLADGCGCDQEGERRREGDGPLEDMVEEQKMVSGRITGLYRRRHINLF